MSEVTAVPEVRKLTQRERLNSVPAFVSENVNVPEWNGEEFEVRSMTVGRKTAMVANATDADGNVDEQALMPELVIACVFDPASGEPTFADADVSWLKNQNAGAVERLAQVGMRLSGMDVAAAVDEGKGD